MSTIKKELESPLVGGFEGLNASQTERCATLSEVILSETFKRVLDIILKSSGQNDDSERVTNVTAIIEALQKNREDLGPDDRKALDLFLGLSEKSELLNVRDRLVQSFGLVSGQKNTNPKSEGRNLHQQLIEKAAKMLDPINPDFCGADGSKMSIGNDGKAYSETNKIPQTGLQLCTSIDLNTGGMSRKILNKAGGIVVEIGDNDFGLDPEHWKGLRANTTKICITQNGVRYHVVMSDDGNLVSNFVSEDRARLILDLKKGIWMVENNKGLFNTGWFKKRTPLDFSPISRQEQ